VWGYLCHVKPPSMDMQPPENRRQLAGR